MGIFKTEDIRKILAATLALNTPLSVMKSAGEGAPKDAVLALYMINKEGKL